jgi:restriction system protein
MAKETLFRILLRQPWWITVLVAIILFAVTHAIFPPLAPFVALPFAGLAVYIAYRQWRGSSPVDADERLAALRAMSWEEFSDLVSVAYTRHGYHVASAERPGYDYTLTKGSRVTLLQCRRWRVNQVGIGPVRELARAVEREEATNGICISAGNFSEPARKLVATEPVMLVSGLDLIELLGSLPKSARGAA